MVNYGSDIHSAQCKSVSFVLGSTYLLFNWHDTQFEKTFPFEVDVYSRSKQVMSSSPVVSDRTLPHFDAHGESAIACSARLVDISFVKQKKAGVAKDSLILRPWRFETKVN